MVFAAIAGVAIIIIGPGLLFLALSKGLRLQAGWIENQTFTRVILGLVLGMGADHFWSGGTTFGDQASGQTPPAASDQKEPPAGDQKPSSAVALLLAASIVMLAIVAPHLDDWLPRLSGFKTSLIEVQLTNLSSTSKAVKPAQREGFVRDVALASLAGFDETIGLDIQFIRDFQLRDIGERRNKRDSADLAKEEERLKAQLEQLQKLEIFFQNFVTPAARCFKAAMDNGLSVEGARYHLRGLADKLTQFVLLEQEENRRRGAVEDRQSRIEDLRKEVVALLREAASAVKGFTDPTENKQCQLALPTVLAPPPPSTAYDLLPHVHVARALLLAFVNHDNFALQVLNDASKKEFKDFSTPRLIALLRYYRGDSVTHYYNELEGLRKLSADRIAIIDHVNRACGVCDKDLRTEKLKERAQLANRIATNDIAYGIAVDVAEGWGAGVDLLPIAEQYLEVLKKTPSNLEMPSILDTIGFVTIVAEAHKAKTSSLDKAKISEAVGMLTRAAARERANLDAQSANGENVDYSDLRTIQVHLSSARALLE
ncbi:hypothetical protein MA20_23705 [Bradyrhizobium japonicum]|uniref:Uncharacterized protein n=1 Tax=Bradyrhizobium japonicum TaxID=375 RepID=A0A0A3XT74_BRAJP|nr:hypothetical protein [Bradyrhizobium japonicum]KGT77575.1 hypothetical protein MA20_23705 [Bradyrhizobium japonicum]